MAVPTLEQIIRFAERLSPADQRRLIQRLEALTQGRESDRVAPDRISPPRSLRGLWGGHFPIDLDLDAALGAIQQEWQAELDEVVRE